MNQPLYDHIGAGYDATRRADEDIARRLYRHLQVFGRGQPVMDIACGSGNYTIALYDLGLSISGVDISGRMIRQARDKNDSIDWHLADVNRLPFRDRFYYGAFCVNAIHHFDELLSPFREVYRILRGGARFVLFTATPEQMEAYWLNHYFPGMMRKSKLQMKESKDIRDALTACGFAVVGFETFLVQPDLKDLFLYSGKHRPELYLNPVVRAGISSFASLADDREIQSGLAALENDVRDGNFENVCSNYASELGDYVYIVAQKPGDESRR